MHTCKIPVELAYQMRYVDKNITLMIEGAHCELDSVSIPCLVEQ